MEIFNRMLCRRSSVPQIDFIRQLPPEISQIILSKLDVKSLANASLVSHKWLSICKSHSKLRLCIRFYRRNSISPMSSRYDLFKLELCATLIIILFIFVFIKRIIFR